MAHRPFPPVYYAITFFSKNVLIVFLFFKEGGYLNFLKKFTSTDSKKNKLFDTKIVQICSDLGFR